MATDIAPAKEDAPMYINVSKEDLVNLVMGCTPRMGKQIRELEELRLGRYMGGMQDKWVWDPIELREQLTEDRLYVLYRELK